MSGAALLGPYGLLLGTFLQGTEPPPTSGNLTTIFLGLTASSLIVVVVAGATLRGLRNLRSSNLRWGILPRRERPDTGAFGPGPVRDEALSPRPRPGPELDMWTNLLTDDPESSGDQ